MATAGLVHSYIPSPDQGVWHLGPIPIRAYALCIVVGIIVAIWWGNLRYRARGGPPGVVLDVAVWAVPFGLVGGRLYHVATDAWRYFGRGANPVQALEIWDGGLGIPGAIALGALGAWIACRRRGVPLPFVADALAPAIVVGQAIGRIGNYANQELYGGPTTMPWGLAIYTRVDPGTGALDNLNGVAISHANPQIVQPTFLYELIWDLLVALAVVIVDRRLRLGHGRAFALYVAAYAFGRFWIELLRTDPATHILYVRINVWVMALLVIGAVYYFIRARRRGQREDPAGFSGAPSTVEPVVSAEPDDPLEPVDA
ncbi:MAG TPA: prolipoprotein diacylglyceryl transferase [Pseudonocardiaceae bacterium]|jgi:prolipoprotein diacylglyceryl transferase|nr:prolipoprotein diacylglyceryl transferase [Pseudonocardiaceae bacterium]